jgi:hypothetical protein
MIFHVKYNYRSSSTGEIFADWFTIGDTILYHVTDKEDVEITIQHITVDDKMVATVSGVDADKNLYTIEQTGVTTVFRKFKNTDGEHKDNQENS